MRMTFRKFKTMRDGNGGLIRVGELFSPVSKSPQWNEEVGSFRGKVSNNTY